MYILPDEPARPTIGSHIFSDNQGLTIRHEFAARAMHGIVSNSMMTEANDLKEIAQRAVLLADRLIEELNKPKT